MGKLPYIPIYIGDWEQDTNCISIEAEGALIKLIFKLWKSPTKGLLSISFQQIAFLLKKSEDNAVKIIQELKDNDVLDIEFLPDKKIKIESRRMLKEALKSKTYSENGAKGGRGNKKNKKQNKSKTKAKLKPNTEDEDENESISKYIKPSEIEFLEYCKKSIPDEYQGLEFSLKAKYQQWVQDEWNDGFGNKIKNWKTKILNTIPHLKNNQNGKHSTQTTTAVAPASFKPFKNK